MSARTMTLPAPRLDDLATVAPLAVRTPLVAVPGPRGSRLWLKLESAQEVRSFKIRGATYALNSRLEELRRTGVVADSGGNHSQALALAGSRLGVPVRIVMAAVVPEGKQQATRAFGARDGSFVLDVSPPDFPAAKARAREVATEDGCRYVSPYDDEDVICGAATVLTETLDQLREYGEPLPASVHAPIGGGGLISGLADVTADLGHPFVLQGHEIDGADSAARSLHSDEPVPVPGPLNPYAEGLAAPMIGACAHRRLRAGLVDGVRVATLAETGAAYEWYRRTVFPDSTDWPWGELPEVSSMVAVAGALRWLAENDVHGGDHVVVVTGGNTDPSKATAALEAWRDEQ